MRYSAPGERGRHVSDRHRVRCCCWRLRRRRDAPNRRPSAAPISSTPSWPAAIATRRATPTASRSPRRHFPAALTFTTPAFIATAPNITPDAETGIGSWSDAEIKRALVEGMRPDHGHLAGVPLAAIMPANFYKALLPEDLDADRRLSAHRQADPQRGPDPVYKAPVRRDPYPDAEAGFSKADVRRSGQARRLSRHHRPLHGMPLGVVARRLGFQDRPRPRRQGVSAARGLAGGIARQHRRQHHLGSDRRHRRLDRSGNRPRHHPGNWARRADAEAADGLRLLCRAEEQPISPTSSLICARCRRCNEAIAKQPVPPRAGRRYSRQGRPPRSRQEVPPE